MKKQTEISLYCHAAVGNMFATMHNPKLRGPKFTWEKFPEMMEQHCRVGVVLSVIMTDRMSKACSDFAAKTARQIAGDWVKVMTE